MADQSDTGAGDPGDDGTDAAPESPYADHELPEAVIEEAERLTRLAREAVVDPERETYLEERRRLLADRGFTARVREEDDVLVLHPEEWVDDGTVYPSRVDDVDRGVEISLSGPGDPEDWEAVESYNADLVAAVRQAGGDVHAANARAFADFMGNHYARRMDTASAEEIREFLDDYYPRNAWPTETQENCVEESLELLFDVADADPPGFRRATR